MEQRPNVAVLSGFGINCETETMAVFEMVSYTIACINKLVNGELSISDYDIMVIPGGSLGDHLGSGRLMGNRLRFGIREQVREFRSPESPLSEYATGFRF